MKKILGVVLMALLLVVSILPLQASAAFVELRQSDVELNGVELSAGRTTVFVERDSVANVRVEFAALQDLEDVRVLARIGGYEHGVIQDVTSPFDIKKDTTRVVNLKLDIPADIEASRPYKLQVEVFNSADSQKYEYDVKLDIEEKRHLVEVADVVFTPGLHVDAGEPLFVKALLKNRGSQTEKNVKVVVQVPELGLEQAVFVEKLVPEADEDKDTVSSTPTNDIWVDIPADAEKKDYRLVVKSVFNEGRDQDAKEYTLTVNGVTSADVTSSKLLVNVPNAAQKVAAGTSVTYKIDLANLNDVTKNIVPELVGLSGWATAVTQPAVVNLDAGEVSQLLVIVRANNDATGERTFILRLLENGKSVKEIPLKATADNNGVVVAGTSNLRTGLEIVFIVLLVILIILGIVIAVRKTGSRNDLEAPMTSSEGGETKSYY